jgi:hypothetical protein
MRLLSAQLRRANATSPERVRLSTGKPAFAQPRVADAVDKVPFPKVQGPADRNCPCRLELHYMTGFDSGNSRGRFPISNGGTHCSEPRCPRQSGERLPFLRRAIVEDAETHRATQEIRRNSKMEPNGSLLASVRDDRFKQLRICVLV